MIRPGFIVALGVGFILAAAASAGARDYFLPGPAVQSYAVILSGASPDSTYGDQIRRWSLSLHDILVKDYGYPRDHIILLMDTAAGKDPRISGDGRRDIIHTRMNGLAARVKPGDQLFFFLFGHGTSNEEEAKFVLGGPDISGREFAAILQSFSKQDIVVVDAASASFPFCTALTGPGRVLVSATRSRAEKYNTVFAQYFIAALAGHAGDRDKNRRVSIWEALVWTTQKVEKWYADQNRIPTEHAALEDNGDGIFSLDTGPGRDDGSLARIAYLDPLPTAPAGGHALNAAELDLNAHIRSLERSVFLLRDRKADMPADAYQQQIEKLLIELARSSRQLRRMANSVEP